MVRSLLPGGHFDAPLFEYCSEGEELLRGNCARRPRESADLNSNRRRHCEERSDEAIQLPLLRQSWIASLRPQ